MITNGLFREVDPGQGVAEQGCHGTDNTRLSHTRISLQQHRLSNLEMGIEWITGIVLFRTFYRTEICEKFIYD